MTDNREDFEIESVDKRDLEAEKFITWKVKLNKSNNKVQALLDCGSEANLISKSYVSPFLFKILNTSWGLATINMKLITTQGMVIVEFEIDDSNRT